MRWYRGAGQVAGLVGVVLAVACAPGPVALPTGPGLPFPDFVTTFAASTRGCRGIHTLTAELAVSGRAGGVRLRGRVHAGLAHPGSLRLEGVAPFGPPLFILVARADQATLVLPREGRFLTSASADLVIEALTGVALDADELRAVLTGCVVSDPQPIAGRSYDDQWIVIDLQGDAAVFLRVVGGTRRVVAARLRPLTIQYGAFAGPVPRSIRLLSPATNDGSSEPVDLRVTLSQIETNVPLDAGAFVVPIPDRAVSLTLDELRRAGPLGRR